jgi:hypothetical protein
MNEMQFICDAPAGKTWFRIETEGEAALESNAMNHAVEKHFRLEREKAKESYQPTSANYIERDIGLNAHLRQQMPMFLTLRDSEGNTLVTAMLPPGGQVDEHFRIIIVAAGNADPYPEHEEAIAALGQHFAIELTHERCFPYRRG